VTLSDLSTERGEAHHERIGDVLVAQADGPGALAAYQAGLAIRDGLAKRDPANTQWQRDLFVSKAKIGDVLVAQGDGPGSFSQAMDSDVGLGLMIQPLDSGIGFMSPIELLDSVCCFSP